MKVTATVTGLKELEAAMMRLEKTATRRTVMRNTLKKAAQPIADQMRSGAAQTPDPGIAESIVSTTRQPKGEAGNAAYAKVMRSTRGAGKAEAVKAMRDARRAAKGSLPPMLWYVGPSDRYRFAHFWEFGIDPHINGGLFAGTRHPGVAATPFIRPAWDANREKALQIITAELRVQIDKALKRQANRQAKAGAK